MPGASRTCRGFSTRHPWRGEKASAPASPPAGPYPSGPAMLGALKGANVKRNGNGNGRSNRTSKIKSALAAASGIDLAVAWQLSRLLMSALCMTPSIAAAAGADRHGCRSSDAGPGMARHRGLRRTREAQGIGSRFCLSRSDGMPRACFFAHFLCAKESESRDSAKRCADTPRSATTGQAQIKRPVQTAAADPVFDQH